jgi:hypothetical protein
MEQNLTDKLAVALAELVVWSGEESHFDYCKRLLRAEKLLKRVAPDVLRAEKAKAKAQADYD